MNLDITKADLESLSISSTDVVRVDISGDIHENVFDVMFDMAGYFIMTRIHHNDKGLHLKINSVSCYDNYKNYEINTSLFVDFKDDMLKLFIDEYIHSYPSVVMMNKKSKLAVVLYKGVSLYIECHHRGAESYHVIKTFDLNSGLECEIDHSEYYKAVRGELKFYINDNCLNKVDAVTIMVDRMYEEAIDNFQYFVRVRRDDYLMPDAFGINNTLDYACYQTKHHSMEECIERAKYKVSELMRFYGIIDYNEIKLRNFSDGEKKIFQDAKFVAVLH